MPHAPAPAGACGYYKNETDNNEKNIHKTRY